MSSGIQTGEEYFGSVTKQRKLMQKATCSKRRLNFDEIKKVVKTLLSS